MVFSSCRRHAPRSPVPLLHWYLHWFSELLLEVLPLIDLVGLDAPHDLALVVLPLLRLDESPAQLSISRKDLAKLKEGFGEVTTHDHKVRDVANKHLAGQVCDDRVCYGLLE